MELTIIAAVSDKGVIGNKGKLPWNIPADRKRFRNLTRNHSVIMGRRTYESLEEKFRPLPERKNIVLSTTLKPQEGIYVARNGRVPSGLENYIHVNSLVEVPQIIERS